MVSNYFERKTQKEEFKQNLINLIESLKNSKVLIYGAGAAFIELERRYDLTKILNIVAISDKKFNKTHQTEYNGIKAIPLGMINKEVFDYILVTNEYYKGIAFFLHTELGIKPEKIKTIFNETINDEARNLNYLYIHKFDKTLPKLLEKLKNKQVILYGSGTYLEVIKKYFDISDLEIIGISDKRFSEQNSEQEFLGYKTIPPEKIPELKPDYVLVSTKFYIRIIEDLHSNLLKGTKIKLKPLVKKSFLNTFIEIQKM